MMVANILFDPDLLWFTSTPSNEIQNYYYDVNYFNVTNLENNDNEEDFYIGAGKNFVFGIFDEFDQIYGMPFCGYRS